MRIANPVVVAVAAAAAATLAIPPAAADGPGYKYFKSRGSAKKPGAYWNPCAVVTYGIDYTYAQRVGMRKRWERQRWQSAIAEVSQTLGVTFRYQGAVKTKSVRAHPRTSSPVDVVITFGNAKARGKYGYRKVLKGQIAGYTRIRWRGTSRKGRYRITSANIVIDAKQVSRFTDVWQSAPDIRPARERTPDLLRTLYIHEFGHAVGLDHVRDKHQIMYPQLQSDRPDTLGSGDRKGLRRMGQQPCF
ncbi:MAG: matrixin family metalloprotease [Candidatus Nanopelagicales bacterium]